MTKVIENLFLQNTLEAYEEAWVTLDRIYGDPFKLHSWPRLAPHGQPRVVETGRFPKEL